MVDSVAEVCAYFLDEVRQALIDCDRPDLSTWYIGVGEIPMDDCCGLLVVRPETVYRYQAFPAEWGDREFCTTGDIAVSLVIVLARCVPVLDERGRFPSSQSLSDAHGGIMTDAAVIWSRVNGDLPDGWLRSGITQNFVGPLGGCVGVETSFTIGLDQSVFTCCQEAT